MKKILMVSLFCFLFVGACSKQNYESSQSIREDDISDLLAIDCSAFDQETSNNSFALIGKFYNDYKCQYFDIDIDSSEEIVIPLKREKTKNKYQLLFEVATGEVLVSTYYVTDAFSNVLDSVIERGEFYKISVDDNVYLPYLADFSIYKGEKTYSVDVLGHLSYQEENRWYRSEKSVDMYELYLEGLSSYYLRPSHTDYQMTFSENATFSYNGVTKTISEVASLVNEIKHTSNYQFPSCQMTTNLFNTVETNNNMAIEDGGDTLYVDKAGIIYNPLDLVASNGEAKIYMIKCSAIREYHFENTSFISDLFSIFE